ncbi:MAG: transcriptional regulator [Pseudomonadota bacterium]
MNISDLLKVNPILVDRVRLAIMANLALVNGPVDFNTLLQELELTKGNLSTHMRKLEESGLVEIKKEFIGRKPKTTYLCTESGKKEIQTYLATVEAVLKQSKKLIK